MRKEKVRGKNGEKEVSLSSWECVFMRNELGMMCVAMRNENE